MRIYEFIIKCIEQTPEREGELSVEMSKTMDKLGAVLKAAHKEEGYGNEIYQIGINDPGIDIIVPDKSK